MAVGWREYASHTVVRFAMIDAIETITEAIPCNIVYGRKQAAQSIAQALSAAGFTIMSKEDVEAVRDKALEDAAVLAEMEGVYFSEATVTWARQNARHPEARLILGMLGEVPGWPADPAAVGVRT